MYTPPFEFWTDEQIAQWIDEKVKSRERESTVLDYKREIDLSGNGGKEILKDITGFANNIGGVILIGVPEDVENKGVPSQNYGIAPQSDLVLTLQNIIQSGASPTLPTTQVREIKVHNATDGRVVYFVYHPGSWARPHMVTLGKEKRFYRRTGEATIPMDEHEIEGLYAERAASKQSVDSYITSVDFGSEVFGAQIVARTIILPLPIRQGVFDPYSAKGGEVLKGRLFFHGTGANPWYPHGEAVVTHLGNNPSKSEFLAKILPTGTTLYSANLSYLLNDSGKISMDLLVDGAYPTGLDVFVKSFYKEIRATGTFVVKIQISGIKDQECGFVVSRYGSYGEKPFYITGNSFEAQIRVTAQELLSDTNEVKNKLRDQVARLIGRWSAPK